VGDWGIDHRGGDARQDIDGGGGQGSGAAMFIGALLDGIPEAFILGITLALGDGISVAFLTAVFVSNSPQGIAGTTSLQQAGFSAFEHGGRLVGLLTVLGYLLAGGLTMLG